MQKVDKCWKRSKNLKNAEPNNFSRILDYVEQKKVRYSQLLSSFAYEGSVPVYLFKQGIKLKDKKRYWLDKA